MEFIVSQVKPQLCLTKQHFIDIIDYKIKKIIKDKGKPDLIIFPESLGLWMCLMRPISRLSKLFSRFLHSHEQNAVKMFSFLGDIEDHNEEITVNLQFAKPVEILGASVFDEEGLLDCIPAYHRLFKLKASLPRRSRFANWLARFADKVFSKIPLRFMAQLFRSQEMLIAYKEAFSSAAKKYDVHIQAGSLYERVIGGTKNVGYVFAPNGSIICRQEKWHPIPFEGMLGIKAGKGLETFEIQGIKCGIAICADLYFSNSIVEQLALNGCQFIAGPSGGIVPYRAWKFDYQKEVEEAQQARARESDVIIGRTYNAGDLLGGLLKFQGLSNIVSPEGLVKIVPEDKLAKEYNLKYEI